jgi:hypothetical protein
LTVSRSTKLSSGVANAAETKKTNTAVRQVYEADRPDFVAGDKNNSVAGHQKREGGSNPKGFTDRAGKIGRHAAPSIAENHSS